MIDTGGTLTLAARALHEKGATRILACATHGVLSGPAIARIDDSPIEEIIITNTIPLDRHEKAKACKKLTVVSVARLLGEAVQRIHAADSVSSLFV